MEYVNAQGKDVAIASAPVVAAAVAAAVQPASIGSDAKALGSTILAEIKSAGAAAASVSTLADVEAFLKAEVSRIETDVAQLQAFAKRQIVAKYLASDEAQVKSLPRIVKIAFAVTLVLAYLAGFVTKAIL